MEMRMNVSRQSKDEQAMLWNGSAARAWTELQPVLDTALKPFEDILVQAVAAKTAHQNIESPVAASMPGRAFDGGYCSVLDVGCGTGTTTLAVARLLGSKGQLANGPRPNGPRPNGPRPSGQRPGDQQPGDQTVGVDISQPMIAVARSRAAAEGSTASFICADAQTHPFEPSSFDIIISRFGVMFFEDPVSAFANLHRAATADAELCFAAWRSPAENPFMTTAERAAGPLLAHIPPREPGAPGQFAFADEARLRYILQASGWANIDIQPLDASCSFPETELVRYFTHLGPLGRVFQEADEHVRTQIIATVREAFAPYVHRDEVRFTAACWKVSARST
jgi:SAM-dependent methyltransferase